MAVFEYKGYNKQGKSVKGLRDADNKRLLRSLLKKEGILATQIVEADEKKSVSKTSFLFRDINLKQFRHVKISDIALATRQLATLLNAGVPMVEALTALIDQVENNALKSIFSEVKTDINEGLSLADALKKHKCFNRIYVNMVKAGETSGALDLVLTRLADFTEGQTQLRNKVMGAMMYPIVMVVVCIVLLMGIMGFVVPKLIHLFENLKVQLPLMTRILISSSTAFTQYWLLILVLFLIFMVIFYRWKSTEKGRFQFDRFKLQMPIFGKIIRMVAVARFARTLSTLLESGVSLMVSLEIVKNVVACGPIEEAIDGVRQSVKEGEDIATPLKSTKQFPPMVTHMIAIGERSGQLEPMLERIAKTYEQQAETRIGVLASLLEPYMIIFMATAVGFIIFSIMIPIMDMSSLVK